MRIMMINMMRIMKRILMRILMRLLTDTVYPGLFYKHLHY